MKEDLSFVDLFSPLTTKKSIIFLTLIGVAIFFFGLFNGFVGDDQLQIERNPIIQSFQYFPLFFKGGTFFIGSEKLAGFSYKPLLVLSFAINYAIGFGSAFPFHLFQIILYIINAIFLFLVSKKFFSLPIAFILSTLFLVHPINSESAFYIADTQEVLFFFFGIASFWIIQNYQSPKALVIASILLFFSFLSKETGVLFLLADSWYIYLFHRKFLNRWSIYANISLICYLLLRFYFIGVVSTESIDSTIAHLSLLQRLYHIPLMIFFYLKTFFLPLDLAISYQWSISSLTFSQFFLPLLIDTVVLSGIGYFGWYLFKKKEKVFTLYLFFSTIFIVGLLFHLQILPLDQTVSERWFYFPMVGLLGMIGMFIQEFSLRNKKYVIGIIVISIIFLSLRTFLRSFDFQNKFTLTTHDLQVSKEAFGLENELSSAYLELGDYKKAKIHAEKSVNLHPSITGFIDLGVAYTLLGDYKNAEAAYKKGLALGDYPITYENLASLSLVYGSTEENKKFIIHALKKYPTDAKLWFYLALLDYKNGNLSSAKEEIKKAYTYSPTEKIRSVYEAMQTNQKINTFYNVPK